MLLVRAFAFVSTLGFAAPGNPAAAGQAVPAEDPDRTKAQKFVSEGVSLAYETTAERQRALGLLKEGLALYERLADAAGQAKALDALGVVHGNLGQRPEALACYRKALPHWRAAGDRVGEAGAQLGIGLELHNLGDSPGAIDAYREALELARAAGDHQTEVISLLNRADIFLEQAGFEAALADLDAAQVVVRDHGVPYGPTVLFKMGNVFRLLGDPDQALDRYRASLAAEPTGRVSRSPAYTLRAMGRTHAELLEDFPEARRCFERALAIARERTGDPILEAGLVDGLGEVELGNGNPAGARVQFERAIAIWEQAQSVVGQTRGLLHLAEAESATGRPDEARRALERALTLAERLGDRTQVARAVLGLARLERDAGRSAEARIRIEHGLEALEEVRSQVLKPELRTSYFATVRYGYDLYVDLLMHLGDGEGAFAASERSRARTLLEAVRAAGTQVTAQTPAVGVREVQALLDESTVLVEYAIGEERSFAWVLTPSSFRAVTLPGRTDLEGKVRRLVGLVNARNEILPAESAAARRRRIATADAAFPGAARALSVDLLGPLRAEMADRRLIVVADGALHSVPFAALPDPGSSGAPLAHRREVISLPSASVLLGLRESAARRNRPSERLAVFADPVFSAGDGRVAPRKDGAPVPPPPPHQAFVLRSAAESGLAGLPRLLFARREADTIAALAPPGATLLAVDFAASRDALARPEVADARLLHFATHGLLNSAHPSRSGLVLSLVDEKGSPRDGFLRLEEIHRLRLSADLVVLSACQTALGRHVRGEGIVGLTRGFLYAGAQGVVSSLWPVQDRATAEWMGRFYEQVLREGASPAAALRSAQVALSKDPRWSAPYFWAAFSYHGDWRTRVAPDAR